MRWWPRKARLPGWGPDAATAAEDWPPAGWDGQSPLPPSPWSHLPLAERVTMLEAAAIELLRMVEADRAELHAVMGQQPMSELNLVERRDTWLGDRLTDLEVRLERLEAFARSLVLDDAELNRVLRGPQDGPDGPNRGSG
jgi:hypothetical protein